MSRSSRSILHAFVLIAFTAGLAGCEALCAFFEIPPAQCALLGGPLPQNLKVAIDVRFIAVDDDFFDRIGVDFDFDFDEQATVETAESPTLDTDAFPIDPFVANATDLGGADGSRLFSPDGYDALTYFLPTVRQGQSGEVVNTFPGLRPALEVPLNRALVSSDFDDVPGGFAISEPWTDVDVASFGYAILSDIEMNLFLTAARADAGNSLLEAPTVTLFNDQKAAVLSENETNVASDLDTPFPAALTQAAPSVQTIVSGPMMEVIPDVSGDLQSVQLSIQPIRAIQFPYPMSATDFGQPITIEFPIIQFSNLQATVSIPDGGTVVLGGIIRSSDGGAERGVPILNRVPYINRVFRNQATILDTQTLLVMVTPRIIIPDEDQ